MNEPILDTLKSYFEPWRDRLPHVAVGAFLSLLGRGLNGVIENLAEEWLGEDLSIEAMRKELVDPSGEDPCASVSVWVAHRVSRGNRVLAINVREDWVEMEAEPDANTLFAFDPDRYPRSQGWLAPLGAFWEIRLRDVEPQSRTSSELIQLLGGTVERWATKYLKLDRERVNDWWSQWGASSKADLRPRARLNQGALAAHTPTARCQR